MRFAVASIDAVTTALSTWEPTVVVTAHRPTMRVPPFTGVQHLRLAFHDVERGAKRPGVQRARPEHVAAMLKLLDDARPERVLLQCTAGLSRSPALALIAMVHAGSTVADACAALHRVIPHASPNRWVLRIGDNVLGLDGALMNGAADTFTPRRTPLVRSAHGQGSWSWKPDRQTATAWEGPGRPIVPEGSRMSREPDDARQRSRERSGWGEACVTIIGPRSYLGGTTCAG